MSISDEDKLVFQYLLNKSMDGQISLTEIQQFNVLLELCPELEEFYVENVLLQYLLYEAQITNCRNQKLEATKFCGFLTETGLVTKNGLDDASAGSNWQHASNLANGRDNKFFNNIRTKKNAIFSCAAVILFLILCGFFIKVIDGGGIARLSDQINTQWAHTGPSLKTGSHLTPTDKLLGLEQGIVKIRYDDGADVLVEGPAEFRLTDSGIFLNYGYLFGHVSNSEFSFTVDTPSVQFVDLGTEFGLKYHDGESELHVFKGKVLVTSDSIVSLESGRVVSENNAIRCSSDLHQIETIPVKDDIFARQINSKLGSIWRGQIAIDLADMVGGGNGLGTGSMNSGIDPVSGNVATELLVTRNASNGYHRVSFTPFIDGVFIPDGKKKQIVSSRGHQFLDCPATSGDSYNNILNVNRTIGPLIYQNVAASELRKSPCILLHANMGVTFDLQAIRAELPDIKIVRFQSKVGIEMNAIRPEAINADFWVLVDGNLKYKRTQVKNRKLDFIDIELSEKDRFLTLVTTDGSDPEGRLMDKLRLTTIDSDWGMFAEPVLILE